MTHLLRATFRKTLAACMNASATFIEGVSAMDLSVGSFPRDPPAKCSQVHLKVEKDIRGTYRLQGQGICSQSTVPEDGGTGLVQIFLDWHWYQTQSALQMGWVMRPLG